MNIEIRIYKRYDTDLLALHDAGYSVNRMMAEALSSYANGMPCYFFLDSLVPFDLNDKNSVRLRLAIKNEDYNTINLIKNIKHGYRSNFCKQILRNALVQQNLICYIADPNFFVLQDANSRHMNPSLFPNMKLASDYRRITQTINVGKETVTVKHEKGYEYNQANRGYNLPQQQVYMPQPQIISPNPAYAAGSIPQVTPAHATALHIEPISPTKMPQTEISVDANAQHAQISSQEPQIATQTEQGFSSSPTVVSGENKANSEPVGVDIVQSTVDDEIPTAASNKNLMAMFDGL